MEQLLEADDPAPSSKPALTGLQKSYFLPHWLVQERPSDTILANEAGMGVCWAAHGKLSLAPKEPQKGALSLSLCAWNTMTGLWQPTCCLEEASTWQRAEQRDKRLRP